APKARLPTPRLAEVAAGPLARARPRTADSLASRLGAQQGERDDVTDRRLASKHHDQAVDAHAEPSRWRHAMLERANVIFVVVHRLLGTAAFLGDLLAKALSLIIRV